VAHEGVAELDGVTSSSTAALVTSPSSAGGGAGPGLNRFASTRSNMLDAANVAALAIGSGTVVRTEEQAQREKDRLNQAELDKKQKVIDDAKREERLRERRKQLAKDVHFDAQGKVIPKIQIAAVKDDPGMLSSEIAAAASVSPSPSSAAGLGSGSAVAFMAVVPAAKSSSSKAARAAAVRNGEEDEDTQPAPPAPYSAATIVRKPPTPAMVAAASQVLALIILVFCSFFNLDTLHDRTMCSKHMLCVCYTAISAKTDRPGGLRPRWCGRR